MKTLILLLFGLLNAVYSPISPNCSCDWEGPFIEMAKESDLVARIKVLDHQEMMEIYEDSIPNAMIVEVMEVYRGTEQRKEVKIWGDNGFLCRPYINIFPIGSEWILSLQKGEQSIEGEAEDDYSIYICGESGLHAVDGQVKGIIFPGNVDKLGDGITYKTQEISLSKLKEGIESSSSN